MLAPCAIDSPGRLRVYKLEEETDADWWEVEALYDLCFAPGRTALSSYRLRDGVPTVAALCLVLRDDDGTLAAAIRYWPVEVAGEDHGSLKPSLVSRGIGFAASCWQSCGLAATPAATL